MRLVGAGMESTISRSPTPVKVGAAVDAAGLEGSAEPTPGSAKGRTPWADRDRRCDGRERRRGLFAILRAG